MSSLVEDLQVGALDEKVSITTLVRQALVCARKLDVGDFETWARSELNGYEKAVPEYRRLHGHLKVETQYHGLRDVRFTDNQMEETISQMPFAFPLAEIQEMLAQSTSGEIAMRYSPKAEQILVKDFHLGDVRPILVIPKSAVAAVLDAVRNIVLNWALELEKRGIMGAGMSFSAADKQQASTINIGTLIQGNVEHSAIQQGTYHSVQSTSIGQLDLAAMRRFIEAVTTAVEASKAASTAEVQELMADIMTLRAQVESPRPKASVVKECLRSARSILEGAAGDLLAQHAPGLIGMASALLRP